MTAVRPATERFAGARQIADAVLFEGYVLYPYRASAAKNRLRWQFGVLVPPGFGQDTGEHPDQCTELLVEPRRGATLTAELRFLRVQRRTVQRLREDGGHEDTEALELADRVLTPWDEGVEERVELSATVDELLAGEVLAPVHCPARTEIEAVREGERTVGRTVRRCAQVDGVLRVRLRPLPGPYAAYRLRAVVENTTAWTPGSQNGREEALANSLVSAHLLLGLDSGSFVSMTDPPEWAKEAVAECRNLRTWPVLAGDDGRADVVLSSPIILEDHPQVAPESPGALYDGTEIDEILALRTSALTEQEKREARGTDPRAGAAVDLADSLPPEVMERLHGAVRALREVTAGPPAEAAVPGVRPDTPWWDPGGDPGVDPATDRVVIDGRAVGAGDRVVLRPGRRRTDAQDLFLQGRTALVEAVLQDVDGAVHVAVTVDGDPGADLWRAQGRFLYFQPDELAPAEET
ncbi:hypothetical protein BX265_5401 [Streptomyces sp. TLI_235]|nr:hypothetical protein [Streptomyces sp. TLI_235]PBC70844.1 hypothetical protein BX265_5401 [Streptomyces sp. TLI_235]